MVYKLQSFYLNFDRIFTYFVYVYQIVTKGFKESLFRNMLFIVSTSVCFVTLELEAQGTKFFIVLVSLDRLVT